MMYRIGPAFGVDQEILHVADLAIAALNVMARHLVRAAQARIA